MKSSGDKLGFWICTFLVFADHVVKAQTPHDAHNQGSVSETNIASQCMYGPGQGLAFVSLYCGFKKVIKIDNVFHGVHTIPNNDCSFIRNDCTAEAKHLYDWSKCEGKHNCVQTASYGRIEKCSATASYIQVEYHCVGEHEVKTKFPDKIPFDEQEEGDNQVTHVPHQEDEVNNVAPKTGLGKSVDICGNTTVEAGIVSLHSPDYPNQYPTSLDCRCEIQAAAKSSLMVNFQDIVLAMRESLCSDWLLVESVGQKGSRVVTCGDLQQKKKSLNTGSDKIVMHFHSTRRRQNPATFRGFRAQITTKPRAKYKLRCFQTDVKSLQLLASSQDLRNRKTQGKGMMLPPTNFSSLSQLSHRDHDVSNGAPSASLLFGLTSSMLVSFSISLL